MKIKHLNFVILGFVLLISFPISNTFADDNNALVESYNKILRGEISAVETYRQGLEKIQSEPEAKELVAILEEHRANVTEFTTLIRKLGGQPSQDSGAWGMWAKAVTGTAKLMGDAAALKALREGEEHGLKEYRDLLEVKGLPVEVRNKVMEIYIPEQEKHIRILDSLIGKNM